MAAKDIYDELVELKRGINLFTIRAYDSWDDIIEPEQKIKIKRMESSVKTTKFRPTVIVGDFEESDEDSGGEQSDVFEEHLKSALARLTINDLDRFIVKSNKDKMKGNTRGGEKEAEVIEPPPLGPPEV